jgi:chromosome segregation ATPase
MTSDYQKDVKQAREELAELLANREQIEIKIARQRRKVAALSELCDETELGDGVSEALESLGLQLGGLSDACRTAMRASRKEWMTIVEIQEALKELGFPLDKYKAATASITTTVNRLVSGKEVVVEKRPSGASEYKWVGLLPADDPARKLAEGARFPKAPRPPKKYRALYGE